jgi:dephospho-CoA kinase
MIIGFAGLAGAGKNEAAKALPFPSVGFADAIKEIIISIDPCISFHQVSGMIHLSSLLKYEPFELIKRNSKELRRLLQELGITMRNINEEFWIDQVWAKISQHQFNNDFCITDVRFLNEISFIKREFMSPGYVIWVERPGVEQGTHASENSIKAEDCDGFVLNDGTIEDLHQKVRDEMFALHKNRLEL